MRVLLILVASLSYGATGNVQFSGTEVDSGNISGSQTCSLAFDGTFTTYWSASITNQWCGVNFGKQVAISSILITPRLDVNGSSCGAGVHACWNRGLGANVLEGSNDGSSWSSALDTFAAYPYLIEGYYNTRAESGSYQYFRLLSPSGYGDLAELQFIGPVVSGVNAQPVAPVASPFGGVYLGGSVTVAMSSQTTSASIYYTKDGTTPSCSGGGTQITYSTPFVLAITGSATQMKVEMIACDASLSKTASAVTSAYFQNYGFAPGQLMYDVDDGIPSQVLSGQIFGPVNGRYYRTGQQMLTGMMPTGVLPTQTPLWLYSSSDLYNWNNEGNMLAFPSGINYITRAHVIWNASTGLWVLWAVCSADDSTSANYVACIATSPTPNGPLTGTNSWSWSNASYQPDGNAFGDDSLWVSPTTGNGYVAYATYHGVDTLTVSQLSSNFLTTDGVHKVTATTSREAPVLFEYGGNCFLVSTPYTAYGSDPRPVDYQTASSCTGTWGSLTNLFTSNPYSTAQSGQLFIDPNVVNGYQLWFDQWGSTVCCADSTPLALPMIFPTSTSAVAVPQSSWDLRFFQTGTPYIYVP